MPDKRSKKQPLEQRVLDFNEQRRLVAPRQILLVAVSGGPDSVCLLHVLKNLQPELGIELHMAHLDHQLRGKESAADARYVKALAKKLDLPVTVGRRNVRSYQNKKGISLEEAAREVRYNFLAEVADTIGADRVAVGHTLDDHIETILLHLIRGTGTKGLSGLMPINKWRSTGKTLTIVRPLLEVSREETAQYCANHKLEPRLDATNLSLIPTRNKIRLELLPLLKKYNPQIIEALLRTSHIAHDDIAFLENEAEALGKQIIHRRGKMITLDRKSFIGLAPSLQRHLLRLSIEKLLGTLRDIEARHIEEIMGALHKPAGKKLNLPFGLIFTIEYERFVLGKNPKALSPFPVLEGEYTLKIPGETVIPGWRIQTSTGQAKQLKNKTGNFTAQFDAAKVGKKLTVRSRQNSDRFQPLGMKAMKKIGEFMIDAKIPRGWRADIPIVCNEEQVVWVVCYRIDERVKVTENTQQVLSVTFEHLSDSPD